MLSNERPPCYFLGLLCLGLRSAFNDGMKKIQQITELVYEKLSWLWTPLFIWMMAATILGWKKFDAWDAIYCLLYVFYIREERQ